MVQISLQFMYARFFKIPLLTLKMVLLYISYFFMPYIHNKYTFASSFSTLWDIYIYFTSTWHYDILPFYACTKFPPLRLLCGQRRYTKHAVLTESDFHGDETKPETVGALFKPLYRGNMLSC